MNESRIIKKYPNRRLYDTELSEYITLDDVKKLVLSDVPFLVKDVKTDHDLTRSILLQIVSEQEHNREPLFTKEVLTQLIHFYGNDHQAAFSDYLLKNLEIFMRNSKISGTAERSNIYEPAENYGESDQ